MGFFSSAWKGIKSVAGGVLGSAGSIASAAGLGPLGSTVVGALGNGISSAAAASESEAAAAAARQWQSEENQKQRDWQSNENQVSRDFNAEQSALSRNWQSAERVATQKYNSAEEQAERLRAAGLNPMSLTDAGTGVSAPSTSSASSVPNSSAMSGLGPMADPTASKAVSSETIRNLAEASKFATDSNRVNALLDGEVQGQQYDNVIKRQTAARQAMENYSLPQKLQSEIFVNMTNGFKNGKSMQVMDGELKSLLAKANLDEANQAYIQFSLAPYMEALAEYYRSAKTKTDEETTTIREIRPAEIAKAWSQVALNKASAADIYRTQQARIDNLNADTGYKNSLTALNQLNYNIRNANANNEVAAAAEQFLNVIQNSAEISDAQKKHMKALADKAKKDANHANARFWQEQISAYGALMLQGASLGMQGAAMLGY